MGASVVRVRLVLMDVTGLPTSRNFELTPLTDRRPRKPNKLNAIPAIYVMRYGSCNSGPGIIRYPVRAEYAQCSRTPETETDIEREGVSCQLKVATPFLRTYSHLCETAREENSDADMSPMRTISAIFAGVLLLAAAACGTFDHVPTQAAPSAAGIDVDPAKAEATLVQLVDALDEPEYYCVDVPGFGRSLNLEAALMAHTCKPGADDEMFAINRPGPGNLYMPAYDLCMEADRAGSPVQIYLRECTGSSLQQFELDSDGRLVLVGTGLCMAVSPEDGEPTGGPSHLRRDLVMLDCGEAERALRQWAFPGSSPE